MLSLTMLKNVRYFNNRYLNNKIRYLNKIATITTSTSNSINSTSTITNPTNSNSVSSITSNPPNITPNPPNITPNSNITSNSDMTSNSNISDFNPKILYQDSDYFFVSKDFKNIDNLDSILIYYEKFTKYCYNKYKFTPYYVYPIEKNCSGIIVIAKNKKAAQHLTNLLENGEKALKARIDIKRAKNDKMTINGELINTASLPIINHYHFTLVRGKPEKGRDVLTLGLMRDNKTLKHKCVTKNGELIRTNYTIIDTFKLPLVSKDLKLSSTLDKDGNKVERKYDVEYLFSLNVFLISRSDFTLLCFKSLILRKNQIRSVCQYLHTPIVGDMKYGGGKFTHLFQHCAGVHFKSVDETKEYLIVDAPNWTEFGVKSLTKVAEAINSPKMGSYFKIYNGLAV